MPKRMRSHFDDEIYLYGDTYYYRGNPPGLNRRVEHSLGLKNGTTQKEVIRAKKELLDALSRGGTSGGKRNFASIASLYVDDRELETKNVKNKRRLSEKTFKETKMVMSMHLIPFFGSKKVEQIDQSTFDDYCRYKSRKNLNLVNHRKVLSHFLKWCIRKNYLKYRLELEIPSYAQKDRRERVVLNDDEVRRLISHADGKILLYVSMYLFMGMRNMEICKLRWSEVNFDEKSIFVNPMNNRTRKMRAIPINPYVFKLLKDRKQSSQSDWVFPSAISNGKKPYMDPAGGIRKPWLSLLKSANLSKHLTPHDLRATFETYMHTNPEFTDTQREKMAGAKIDVQKDTYVKMQVEQLRGLENSVNITGLNAIFKGKSGGKSGGRELKKKA
jgi:integrase